MNEELHKGFAIIIDDLLPASVIPEIGIPKGKRADDIFKIVEQIEQKGIPSCCFNKIPNNQIIEHFENLNFILLDWKLYQEPAEEVKLPSGLIEQYKKNNIDFLKKIRQKCFCPIFIFSNEAIEDIIDILEESELYNKTEEERNFIFVKSKSELTKTENLFEIIKEWVLKHPTVYLIKKWEMMFNETKNKTFWHLYNRSSLWPKILAKSYKDDQINIPENFNDTIYRLIKASSKLKGLEENIFEISSNEKFDQKEISDVIKGLTYIDSSLLDNNDVRLGDIFKNDRKYFLNIRPECDTIMGRASYDGDIYLIKGSELTSSQKLDYLKKHYSEEMGFLEVHNESITIGLDNKEIVCFKFNKIYTQKAVAFLNKRICRLLPPYSNYIQQRFNSYMGRIAIPRYPNEIVQEMQKEKRPILDKRKKE